MRADREHRFAKIIQEAATWLGLAGGLLGFAFLIALGTRGFDYLIGRNYPFQSIGDFLNLKQPHTGIEEWDKSSLLAIAAFLIFMVVGGLSNAAEWLGKTPEQKQRERAERKEAEEHEKRQKEELRLARKAARKPMSGWRRLWIVLSIVFGIATYLVAYDVYSRSSAFVAYKGNAEAFRQRARDTKELSHCDWSTAKVETELPINGEYLITCSNFDPWLFSLLWALVPAVVMAAVGLTVRWIYRGFRPPRHAQLEGERK